MGDRGEGQEVTRKMKRNEEGEVHAILNLRGLQCHNGEIDGHARDFLGEKETWLLWGWERRMVKAEESPKARLLWVARLGRRSWTPPATSHIARKFFFSKYSLSISSLNFIFFSPIRYDPNASRARRTGKGPSAFYEKRNGSQKKRSRSSLSF